MLEQEPVGGRDPNVKRNAGIHKASGDLLALADSDIVMQPDWLSQAVSLLGEYPVQCVAGGMRRIEDTFWGRFVDGNRFAAKTPRVPEHRIVHRRNFGRRGQKPPITANVLFTRDLYEAHPLDVSWLYGYEDYEWFWRIAKGGFRVLFAGGLDGAHHHRRSLRGLIKEYYRSATGCARLIRAHPDCPLSRRRYRQARILPLLGAAICGAAAAAVLAGYWAAVAVTAAACYLLAVGWEMTRVRRIDTLTYPAIAFLLGAVYVAGMVKGLTDGG